MEKFRLVEKEIALKGSTFVLSHLPPGQYFDIFEKTPEGKKKIGGGRFAFGAGILYIAELTVKEDCRGRGFLRPVAKFLAGLRPGTRSISMVWAGETVRGGKPTEFNWVVAKDGSVRRLREPNANAGQHKRPRRTTAATRRRAR